MKHIYFLINLWGDPIIKFCPICDNLLNSRNKRLYCRVCRQEFEIAKEEKTELRLKKTFNNQAGFENVPVVKGLFKKKGISTQER
ncbi:MAG: hypothetical protein EU550_03500, partial [Promethearchaeota archaeon]